MFSFLCLHRSPWMGFWKTQIKPEALPEEAAASLSFTIFAFAQFMAGPFLYPY